MTVVRPAILAAFVLLAGLFGLGLGGFVDGIILHQVLQWHHMISDVEKYPTTTVAGLQVNTLADGFFHLATWFLVLAGSITALHAWREGRVAPSWLPTPFDQG